MSGSTSQDVNEIAASSEVVNHSELEMEQLLLDVSPDVKSDLTTEIQSDREYIYLEKLFYIEIYKILKIQENFDFYIRESYIQQLKISLFIISNIKLDSKNTIKNLLIDLIDVNRNREYIKEILDLLFLIDCDKKSKIHILSTVIKRIRSSDNYSSMLTSFLISYLNANSGNRKILHNYLKSVLRANKSDVNKAFEIYDIWSNLEPQNPDVCSDYASAIDIIGNYELSKNLFETAMKMPNQNSSNSKAYLKFLRRYKSYDKALEIISQYSREDSLDLSILKKCYHISIETKVFKYFFDIVKNFLNQEFNSDTKSKKVITRINTYGEGLFRRNFYNESFDVFKLILNVDSNNKFALDYCLEILKIQCNSEQILSFYRDVLGNNVDDIFFLNKEAKKQITFDRYNIAFILYEKSLQIETDNTYTLIEYGNILFRLGNYIRACELYKHALKINKNDTYTLICLANTLTKLGDFHESISLYEYALNLDPNDIRALTCYANTLVKLKNYEKANRFFEIALSLNANDIITLNNYANALVQEERFELAFKIFNKCLSLSQEDIITLNNYANALAKLDRYEEALKLFEQSLKLNPNNKRTIINYANLLNQLNKFEKLVEIQPNNSYARLQYARQLESANKHSQALTHLLAIDLDSQSKYHSNIVRLHIGRLYYRLNKPYLGKQCFELAIANSDEQDKTILYAARSLLATNPNSQEAINLLRQIQEDSPRYAEAMKAIALNADAETSYELFGADEEQIDDIEMLYRAMYHKIGNEIAVLRSISYRLLKRMEGEHPLVKEIVNDFEKLQQGIASQRANEKAAIAETSHSNYKQLIEIVSKTAHDISDEVNNQLAVIESKTRRAMRKLTAEAPQYQQFEKLLLQLKITQKAINDLKSINEGKTIRRNRFLVHQLFEKWEPANWTSQPRIDGVRILLNIRNPDSEFNGDEEKIKSILNELVENSLKHNHGNSNLTIRMYSSDIDNPMDVGSPTIPGDRKFLYIDFKDDGQGVPDDKKEWIFQPLKTTSPEDKGSGLGLFIARKTIKKMGGQIREVGEAGKGVRFQIYLPYLSSNAL
jgi:tetratricopeptide (TPR) repeat protein/anti-sigma regulatory factor (Ser/Thr protein kinase)